MNYFRPRCVRSIRAFTVVELLVVISIIAILCAMLLPALREAKKTARIAICGSNMRQIGMLLATYNSDGNGYVAPPASPHNMRDYGTVGTAQYNSMSASIALVASRIVDAPPNFTCPDNHNPDGTVTAHMYPSGLGWFFWMGYLPPTQKGRAPGILDCPDTSPYNNAASGSFASYPLYLERQFAQFSSQTAGLAMRDINVVVNPGFGLNDCGLSGALGYGFRGWLSKASVCNQGFKALTPKADRWTPETAILVDLERENSGGFTNYLDSHEDGLNILNASGAVKFGGKDLNGLKPHVYYSSIISGSSSIQAGPLGAGATATDKLWSYYSTGIP